jgi:adenosylhomocysteine nucleosidase
MIAVTFAHPSESGDFLRLIGGRHTELRVLHTGIGAKACRKSIGPFLDQEPFKLVISGGFAGGLDGSLEPGDLFLAGNYSDPELISCACKLIIAHSGKLVTADRVLESAEERAQFARKHQAVAVDMETECIAEACAARRLPLLSLRAISDTPRRPLPAPANVLFDLARQRTIVRRLATHLLTHPAGIIRLARFGRQLANARAELGIGLKTLAEELPELLA